ncbi:MAG: sodium:calcium antiporter [Bacteroidetes bacterium]|nr:sodium:calcium antiporter [Bacteroidota bacterium]
MDAWITGIVEPLPLIVLFVIIAGALLILMKGADLLVDQAVSLSVRWGVPKILIGATIVSIGTTLPEAAVSVLAAIQGVPGLALGNSVGSIIADTGLILGLAVLIGRVPVDQKIVNRQSWIQMGSAVLLVLVSTPFLAVSGMFTEGGRIPQIIGFVFLALLGLYIWRSITWSKSAPADTVDDSTVTIDSDVKPVIAILELVLGVALVILSSKILIPAVEETALRLHIPDAIIAATLVAFGTSLPELVTAITAVRKGHGELALGNVLGADVLNVLFVSGAAAAVTKGGLEVPPQFFYLFFPSMLFVVLVLRIGIGRTTHQFSKLFGAILLLAYIITVVLGYVIPGAVVS